MGVERWSKLDIEPEERCIGQITRNPIPVRPEFNEKKRNCRICNYDPKNNANCIIYQDPKNRVSVWIYEVVEDERG